MYNEYFGFKETPFSIAPDPRYLYMTGQHREALAHLVYGLNSEGGCILLTGEVGTGKTTVCRCLLEQVPDEANIALVLNPKVTAIELLETICDELGINYPEEDNTVKTYTDLINQFLIEANARNEKTVLIIDEAQNLDSTVLEQLRLLTNLETNQRKLLQIIILGQPELLDILSTKEMRQLSQRITARYHLNGLSSSEVKAYINHRLAVAGQNARLFPDDTIKQLYRLSNGIPRLINVLCDRALLGTYVQGKPVVDASTLSNAAKEVFGAIKGSGGDAYYIQLWQIVAAIATIFIILSAVIFYLLFDRSIDVPDMAYNRPDSSVMQQEYLSLEETEISTDDISSDNQVDYSAEFELDEPASPTMEEPSLNNTATIETIEPVKETTAPAIPSPVATTSKPDLIRQFILGIDDNNKPDAFAAIFKAWNRKYPKTMRACTFASNEGLACLHSRGNLNSLRKLNRPAVLKLYNDDGKIGYAIITKLDKDIATLETGWDRFDTNIETLETHWYGEYTLIWQKPPYYKAAVQPGTTGPIVQWLDQQLARIYGQAKEPTIHSTYTDDLITNVKRFQQSKGLVPDGIAGPLTFIHLNSEIGETIPFLNKQGKSRDS